MYLNSMEVGILKKVVNSIRNKNLEDEISILQNKITENEKRLEQQRNVVNKAIDFSEVICF